MSLLLSLHYIAYTTFGRLDIERYNISSTDVSDIASALIGITIYCVDVTMKVSTDKCFSNLTAFKLISG